MIRLKEIPFPRLFLALIFVSVQGFGNSLCRDYAKRLVLENIKYHSNKDLGGSVEGLFEKYVNGLLNVSRNLNETEKAMLDQAQDIKAELSELDNLVVENFDSENLETYFRQAREKHNLSPNEAQELMDWFREKQRGSEASNSPPPAFLVGPMSGEKINSQNSEIKRIADEKLALRLRQEEALKRATTPFIKRLRLIDPQRDPEKMAPLWRQLEQVREQFPELSDTEVARKVTDFAHREKIIDPLDFISEEETQRRAPRRSLRPDERLPKLRAGISIDQLEYYERNQKKPASDYLVHLFKQGYAMPDIVKLFNEKVGHKNTESENFRDERSILDYIANNPARFDIHWGERLGNVDARIATKRQDNGKPFEIGVDLLADGKRAFFANPARSIPNFSRMFHGTEDYFIKLLEANPEVIALWNPPPRAEAAKRAAKKWLIRRALSFADAYGALGPDEITKILSNPKVLEKKIKLQKGASILGDKAGYQIFDSLEEYSEMLAEGMQL